MPYTHCIRAYLPRIPRPLAALALVALFAAPAVYAAASSDDPLWRERAAVMDSLLAGYWSLKMQDAYTPERGKELAVAVADAFHAPETFQPHAANELSLDTNVSTERILSYRADMRVAVAPMITAEQHEFMLFAAFVETRDRSWLDRLAKAAENYRAVERNLLALHVPQDAALEHLRVANAIGAFAENLERMVRFCRRSARNHGALENV